MSAGKVTKAESQSLAKSKSTFREYAEAIGMALLLALFIRTFIVQAFKIPSGSMIPTLQIGDHILVNKLAYGIRVPFLEDYVIDFSKPKRGDVIVFIFPEDRSKDFIKRVIGLPGETLEVRNKKVYINGKPLEDKYVHFIFPPEERAPGDVSFDVSDKRDYGPVTVPERHYFMMGDNRDNSEDSRYWGFMPADYIKGKALFVYFSFTDPEARDSGGSFGVRWSRLLHQIH